MKAKDIRVGGHYKAKVNGRVVTVRVDRIRDSANYRAGRHLTPTKLYDVTNLTTNRETTFRSAGKFREEVVTKAPAAPYDLAIVERHSAAGPCTCLDCTAYQKAVGPMMDGPDGQDS